MCRVRFRLSLTLSVKRQPGSQVGICCVSNMKRKYFKSAAFIVSILNGGLVFSSSVFFSSHVQDVITD